MDKKALFKIGYGLYLLSAKDDKDNACVINTLIQITSNHPIRCLISLSKANYTHEIIEKTGVFNVTILTTEAPFEIFEKFGYHSGKHEDKLHGMNLKRAENGIVYFEAYANSYISAKVIESVDCLTHTIFIAEITDAIIISDKESVTYDYYHKNIKPKPSTEIKVGWRCDICGYIYEGEFLPPDFICPICKHGAADFSKIEIKK